MCSFSAGARRCKIRHIPCMIQCIFPSDDDAGRCSIRHIPCIGSFGAGAGRCSIHHIPCIDSFYIGTGRHSIPCITCICSFRAGAGTSLFFRHVPQCSGSLSLILHVVVSCSTQSCQAPPLVCVSSCLFGFPHQPACKSFPSPSGVCSFSLADSSPSLKRIAGTRDCLLKVLM